MSLNTQTAAPADTDENPVYPVSKDFAENAHIDTAKYDAMYAASVADPEAFWAEQGKRIDWIKPFSRVKDINYQYPDVAIEFAPEPLNGGPTQHLMCNIPGGIRVEFIAPAA